MAAAVAVLPMISAGPRRSFAMLAKRSPVAAASANTI